LLKRSIMETARLHREQQLPDIDVLVRSLIELVELCDREEAGAGLPDLYTARLYRDFDILVHAFDQVTRALRPDEAATFGGYVQEQLLPLMKRGANSSRWFEKPRGYAGDFLTIAKIYDDVATGHGIVDALIDRCFLNLPAARAVQNRRSLLSDEIRATIAWSAHRPVRITSLACGPAREVFDLGARPDLVATLLDIDDAALSYCAAHRSRAGIAEEAMPLIEANLMHIALGRRRFDLQNQDLVYSIGLIDYLGDALVVKLLDYIHTTLRPGGRVILGNFHTRNPTKAFMDHVLEWKLIHRSEADMRRLFTASAFGKCTRISYEPQRINLFAEATR
jgi:extracellular factor (EF) 3-hydroxypalmitic acid methyl ester biosynthesis protein